MKDINFINNKTANKDITHWLRISALLIITTISSMTFITIRQLLKIRIMKDEIREYCAETESLNKVIEKKKNLEKEQTILKKQYNTISKIKSVPKKEFELLEKIEKLTSKNMSLKSIAITKNNIDLQVACSDERMANWLIQQISEFPLIKNLKLTSINTRNKILVFDIKGEITKNA